MNRILLKNTLFIFILLFFAFSANMNAQCSITTTTNASVITFGGTGQLSSCNGIVYIGDGTSTMSLLMNVDLDLKYLGAIQFIVRKNATLDFDAGNNKNLLLAAGSSIQFESGASIKSDNNCSGSDRITIGNSPVAVCSGNSAPLTFDQLVNQGGYSPISVSSNPTSICGSGSINLTATASGSPTYKWYNVSTGGTVLSTTNPYSPTISATTTYYVEAVYSGYTTVRKSVTVTVNPRPTSVVSGTATTCDGTSKTVSVALSGTGPWNLTYSDGSTSTNVTSIASSPYTFSVSPTSTKTYTVTALSDSKCTAIAGDMTGSAVITVNPVHTITAGSNQAVCQNTAMTGITMTLGGGATGATVTGLPTGVTSSVLGTTLTISGTPSVSGSFLYSVTTTGNSCAVATTSGTITVNPSSSNPGGISVNGAAAGTVTTYCASTSAVFSVAAMTNAGSYTWNFPTGWTIVSGQGTAAVTVVTGTSAQSGNVSVYASNLCTPSYQPIALSTIPPIAPTTALVRPDCSIPTGSITVTKPVPATGIVYTVTGTNPVVAAVSNTTGHFSGLATGDYKVTYQNGSGCVSSAQTVSIQAANANTWDGIKWSKTNDTTPPTSGDVVVFEKNYDPNLIVELKNADIQGCSCEVKASVTVTIPSGKTMTITNGVSNGGTLIFENGASLVQFNDDALNTGEIKYRRISAAMKNFDYTYWSSPVAGQELYKLSPNTLWDKYYSFENGTWKVYPNGAGTMDPGKGFIIRVPKPQFWSDQTATSYAQPVQFEGIPNNGEISIASQGVGKDNLIGNPYPSAIDADLFITENASVIGGALYFWTHNTAITQSGSFYVYSSNDYATYTLTGGAGTTTGASSTVGAPSGKIAAGQAFFVRSSSNASGSFKFNNSMRISASGSNSQFFKLSQTKKMAGKIEKNRVWLNLTNSDGIFKQLLVGYITGATNEMDNLYDGVSYDGNTYVDFYSVNKENKLTIQGRALPFDKADKVPLGYRSTIQGTFKISIDKVDGVLANQTVFIEDNVTKTIHNLKDGPYSFTTAKGTFDDRFVLVYVDKNAVVIDPPVVVNPPVVVDPPVTVDSPVVVSPPVVVDPPVTVNPPVSSVDPTIDKPVNDNKNKDVIVSVKNSQIKINSFDQIIELIMVYDLRGRQLYENINVKSNESVISSLNSSDQFLIVMVQLTNGKWVTKEIIFKK